MAFYPLVVCPQKREFDMSMTSTGFVDMCIVLCAHRTRHFAQFDFINRNFDHETKVGSHQIQISVI